MIVRGVEGHNKELLLVRVNLKRFYCKYSYYYCNCCSTILKKSSPVLVIELVGNLKHVLYICRNLCLSLQPGAAKNNILLLWQHECFWLYGRRMVNDVDYRRFRQAFVTAVRKQFSDDEQVGGIVLNTVSSCSQEAVL